MKVWALVLAVSVSLARAYAAALTETADPAEWTAYGRTYDETHYSPLANVNSANVGQLGLAWWFDIPAVSRASSVPLEVNGRLYFVSGYSVVRALDASTGQLLWTYDPEVAEVAGHKLRVFTGVRGIAYWDKKVYVATQEGRLIALSGETGRLVWSVETTKRNDSRRITGPPLAFKGKILIGHAGDLSKDRPYVSAYDAQTGKRLWRFFTVPGDPSKGFENVAMARAAKTWTGRWWIHGTGGAVWNAMTYDGDLDRVYIGTSNGWPYDRNVRSPKGGDNLFVASIIALNANTGDYVWHYQVNPGDTWDFDATNDLELATLEIGGAKRRVLLQASKNGFFYVIDRDTERVISAEKFARATWADRIDLSTGRPVEVAQARTESARLTTWPSELGAHGWEPMAFSPKTGLVYIPVVDAPMSVFLQSGEIGSTSASLLAWDPVRQRVAWQDRLPISMNGGIAVTAGNLVFEGRYDGRFAAYAADTGMELWSFDAQVGIVGAPITYQVADRQYVSVVAGFYSYGGPLKSQWDARTQRRRVLTFTLGGQAHLPPAPAPYRIIPIADPEFKSDESKEQKGAAVFNTECLTCHGSDAMATGSAPDLRASPLILSIAGFRSTVQGGALLRRGMPRFEELTDTQLECIRQYLRARAQDMATHRSARPIPSATTY